MSEETYYSALGVAENATRAEIKKAYRSLLKKIHPDTVSTLSEETRRHAEDATQLIIEAYSVLSDSTQRSEYDRYLGGQRAMATANASREALNVPRPTTQCRRCGAVVYVGESCPKCRFRRRRQSRRHRRRRAIRDWMIVIASAVLALTGLAALAYCIYVFVRHS